MNLKTPAALMVGIATSLSPINTSFAANSEDSDKFTIVITGTRTAQTVDQSLAPVTIIDRAQIDSHPASSLEELLRSTPGLNVIRNGGPGGTASVFMRGTESDHTLFLIDGVRIGSATSGAAALQDFPLSQIERIEIVRGPRSSLYGSEAIGGVIQLFLKKPSNDRQSNFSVSSGSHSSHGLNAGLSGRTKQAWYMANFSSFKTDGFDACRAEAATEFGGCFADQPDADGYQNRALSLAVGGALGERVEGSLSVFRVASELDYDGSFSNQRKSRNQIVSAKLDIDASERWGMMINAAQSQDHSDEFNQGVFSSRFDTDRDQLGWQNNILLNSNGLLTFGLDHYTDKVSGTTDYTIASRDNTGLYAQYLGEVARHDVQLSLRHDDNEQFSGKSTGGLSVGRDFANGLRLTTAFGTAFNAPSFNDLYYPGFGNADLSAETSRSLDIGLSGRSEKANFSVNVFETNIENLIAYDAAAMKPLNIGKARIAGLEASVGIELVGWLLNTSLSIQSPKNTGSGANKGNYLARRPEHSVNLGLSRKWNQLSAQIDIHSQGHSFDDVANTKRLAGYTLVDLNLAYQINAHWAFDLAINNLFDKQYETAEYFNQDGLNGLLKVRYLP